ncbi:LOW QUALITY PROTEIN: nmrA-like family domain-containing protein 1 [Pterocles gutturalis]
MDRLPRPAGESRAESSRGERNRRQPGPAEQTRAEPTAVGSSRAEVRGRGSGRTRAPALGLRRPPPCPGQPARGGRARGTEPQPLRAHTAVGPVCLALAEPRHRPRFLTAEQKLTAVFGAPADEDDEPLLELVLVCAYGAFAVTSFWERCSKERGIVQGKQLVDLLKHLGLHHVVYSGLENMKQLMGQLEVLHSASKGVEEYFQDVGVPTRTILPFYFNFLFNFYALKPDYNAGLTMKLNPKACTFPQRAADNKAAFQPFLASSSTCASAAGSRNQPRR